MILYHYTTMDTFISMMEHSLFHQNDNLEPTHLIMWAGHSSFQNDPTECKLYFEGLRKAIENYCLNNSCNLMEEYDKLINEPERGLSLYFISFSEQEDDLTMWRGYGQNGDGISLGFDFDKLPDDPLMCLRDRDNPDNNNYQLDTRLIYNKDYPIKCVYTEPNDIKIEEDTCRRTIQNLQDEDQGKDKEWRDVIQHLIDCQEAPKYKHFKYEAEKEHRIVKIGELPKFRKGKDGFPTPYIEVGIPISCLQQIIIGPCQASDNNVKRVKVLLCSKLLDIPIKKSIIPYRNKI